MPFNSTEAVRIISFVPLTIATWKTVELRHLMPSRAWNFITGAFVLFFLLVAFSLFQMVPPVWRLGLTLVGYIMLALGFTDLVTAVREVASRRYPLNHDSRSD